MDTIQKFEDGNLYNFNDSIVIGEQGESIIEKYLKSLPHIKSIQCVRNVFKYRQADIDFLVKLKNDKKVSIEVKTDTYKTGNMYYETKSCIEENTLGCFEKTEADFIFYYFIELDRLYIFKTKELRNWVRQEIVRFYNNPNSSRLSLKKVYNKRKQEEDGTYTSEGFTIPTGYLEQQLLNKRIFKKYDKISVGINQAS